MPDETHDPRIDPRPGDVLRKGSVLRSVIYREYGAGKTQMANRVQVADGGWIKKPREKRPSLKQFREWARNAEVVTVAHEVSNA